jgi:hypothetical protein
MASDALIRANKVLPKVPVAFIVEQFRAALDPTDEAMAEVVSDEVDGYMSRALADKIARAAIIAIRNHITGGTGDGWWDDLDARAEDARVDFYGIEDQ